jgi:hypothetical protein
MVQGAPSRQPPDNLDVSQMAAVAAHEHRRHQAAHGGAKLDSWFGRADPWRLKASFKAMQ